VASLTPVRMAGPTALTTSSAVLFTATKKTLLRQLVLANTSASAVTATVSLVPSGGTAGTSNRLLGGASVAANDDQVLDLWQVLEVGDKLAALAGTGAVLVLTASGVEIG
jgi:hypothetical protein